MTDDGQRRLSEFTAPGGAGWFVTFVARLREIHDRYGLIKNEFLLADLIIDGWPELDAMSKRDALRWVRRGRIEVDHLLVQERICEIIEAREHGDEILLTVLLEAFPADIQLRLEMSAAQRKDWVSKARLAARGEFRRKLANGIMLEDDGLLEHERGERADAICGLTAAGRNRGIYFVTADHVFVKIGFAIDVAARVRTLQTSMPQPLHVLIVIAGSLSDERALHRRFDADHAAGEWFRLSAQIHKFIEEQCRINTPGNFP